MQQERNLLIKKVFPEIKRVCAKRKVNFVYVGRLHYFVIVLTNERLISLMNSDFRWGITSEESSGGKVISLCLNEVSAIFQDEVIHNNPFYLKD